MAKRIEDIVTDWIDGLDMDELLVVANCLNIDHRHEYWLKHEYYDKEENLRIRVRDEIVLIIQL